jgi:hypothetical protein
MPKTPVPVEKVDSKNSLFSRAKRMFSVPDVVGTIANVVIFLKILEAVLKRDFHGIIGKATSFFSKMETELIDALWQLLPSKWLKDFLTFNLDTLLIVTLLFFMSLASGTSMIKTMGVGDKNTNKIVDTLISAFFVTFGCSVLLLLNAARGCGQSGLCDIVKHGNIALSVPLRDIYSVGGIFVASNVIGVPLLFVVHRLKLNFRAILLTYATIAYQLVLFSGAVLVSLIIAGFS